MLAELATNPPIEQSVAHKPIALVEGAPYLELPTDLYIPPDALEVILETFEGPLDLLLYLIKRHNMDILNIPIAEVTHQYMHYIELMRDMRFELAAEYLLMAAMLAEIKSRLLLPRPESVTEDEADPRAELVRRLREYEQFKHAAEQLDVLPRYERDVFKVSVLLPAWEVKKQFPDVELEAVLRAFADVLKRAELYESHRIQREPLSIRARMSDILARIQTGTRVEFYELFTLEEGRLGVVVSFIAMLELLKQGLIDIIQSDQFSAIHIQAKRVEEHVG